MNEPSCLIQWTISDFVFRRLPKMGPDAAEKVCSFLFLITIGINSDLAGSLHVSLRVVCRLAARRSVRFSFFIGQKSTGSSPF